MDTVVVGGQKYKIETHADIAARNGHGPRKSKPVLFLSGGTLQCSGCLAVQVIGVPGAWIDPDRPIK
jgi:hypothetical protein